MSWAKTIVAGWLAVFAVLAASAQERYPVFLEAELSGERFATPDDWQRNG